MEGDTFADFALLRPPSVWPSVPLDVFFGVLFNFQPNIMLSIEPVALAGDAELDVFDALEEFADVVLELRFGRLYGFVGSVTAPPNDAACA